MKKFLAIFGALGLMATSATTVVACGETSPKDLSEVIPTTNLGSIEAAGSTPTAAEVIAGIKAISANRSLNENEVTVGTITATSATVTVNEGSTVYLEGKVDVTYTLRLPDTRVELNTVLRTRALGEITTSTGQNPSADQILDAAVAVNSGLNKAELKVDNITNRSANISPNDNSTVYKGAAISVNFSVKDGRPELNTVITTTSLGQINQAGALPTTAEIISAIKAIAANRGLNENEVTVSGIGQTSATVAVNASSIVYIPGSSVQVTYTLDDRLPIDAVVTVTALGPITTTRATPSSQEVLDAAKASNPSLNTDSLRVTDITATSATIVPLGGSAYRPNSSVNVTFTVTRG